MNAEKLTGKLFCALAAMILCAVSIAAQDFAGYRFDEKAVKGAKISNLDLIKKIFPDAQINAQVPDEASAAETIPLRHLFGEKRKNISGERIFINIGERLETIDGGRGRVLWMIINAVRRNKENSLTLWSEQAKVLAAFRVSGNEAELIDAADVQTQNITTFDESSPKLRIAPNREAVVISNVANASIGHSEVSIVAAGKNGFDVLLNQFRMTTDYRCTDWFNETANVQALKNPVKGFRNVAIVVKVEGGPGEMEFARVKYRRRFRYVFAWQRRLQKYRALVNPARRRQAFLKRIEPCRQLGSDDEN